MPTDDVGMEYRVLSDPDNIGLEAAFENQRALFEKALRRNVDKHVVTAVEGKIPEGKDETVIAEEEQELHKATFLLRFIKL
jgi:isoleucyl-tRNA synthetase